MPKAVTLGLTVFEIPKAIADTSQTAQAGPGDVQPMKPTSKAVEMPKPLADTSPIAAVQITQGEAQPMKPSSKAAAMTQDRNTAAQSWDVTGSGGPRGWGQDISLLHIYVPLKT